MMIFRTQIFRSNVSCWLAENEMRLINLPLFDGCSSICQEVRELLMQSLISSRDFLFTSPSTSLCARHFPVLLCFILPVDSKINSVQSSPHELVNSTLGPSPTESNGKSLFVQMCLNFNNTTGQWRPERAP